jgi:flagellin
MGFRIQHNVTAMTAHRALGVNENSMNKSLERLSSGFRINSAADDAAGLASSMRFRAEIASLKVASRNAAEATSLLQVAEGAMSQIELILVRMKELATQASSGNAGSDLSKINLEASALQSEINRIVGFTQYNSHTLLDGSFGTVSLSSTPPAQFVPINGVENIDVSGAAGETTFYISAISYSANTMTLSNGTVSQTLDYSGAIGMSPNINYTLDFNELGVSFTLNSAFETNEASYTAWDGADPLSGGYVATGATGIATFQLGDQNNGYSKLGFTLPDLSLASLASGSAFSIDLTTQPGALTALDTIDGAISRLASARAEVGALMNRVQYTSSNLAVSIENKTASESVIRDVDMAMEMSEFTKNNILVQAGMSMLAQAQQVPQSLLQLLR